MEFSFIFSKIRILVYKKEKKVSDARLYIQEDEFVKKNEKLKIYYSETKLVSYFFNLKNAASAYMTWNPTKKYYAIGYTSVKSDFDGFLKNPESKYHKPNQNL